jgi:hypothetical protein
MNDRSGSRTRVGRAVVISERGALDLVGVDGLVGVAGADGVADGAGAARAAGSPVAGPAAAASPGRSDRPVEQAARSSATTAPAGQVLPTRQA